MGGSSKAKVLLLGEIENAHDEWNALSSLAELITPKSSERAGFIEECRAGAFDGVVAVYRTFGSISISGRFDEELVAVLPASVRFVSHNGAGYDQVEIPPCTARGIRVSNVPTAVDDATADVTIFLMLGALRGLNASMLALRAGHWRGNPLPPLGHDPEGKLLGIVGMGGIGRNVKRKAEAFGMTVQYHNRKELRAELAGGARYVGFDELLATSDVISLNLPLNKQTHHILSHGEFARMKRGVVIVNSARGAVIDEAALVAALDSGQVASCGLDVYEDEPTVHPGLLANPHVMLVPHMGTWTRETQTAMERWNIGNVRAALETGRLNSPVPEQADM
ncbi:MAG: hypothetical protein M1832_005182 [Thelocarpon impressellum]|nr:MAG: hypothetical protein M1832_005182 [Thelocarpon impressellum]